MYTPIQCCKQMALLHLLGSCAGGKWDLGGGKGYRCWWWGWWHSPCLVRTQPANLLHQQLCLSQKMGEHPEFPSQVSDFSAWLMKALCPTGTSRPQCGRDVCSPQREPHAPASCPGQGCPLAAGLCPFSCPSPAWHIHSFSSRSRRPVISKAGNKKHFQSPAPAAREAMGSFHPHLLLASPGSADEQ